MTIAETLTSSRTQQLQARMALRAGNAEGARKLFAAALDARLAADVLDPGHSDPAWLDDALHPPIPGERERRYHRIPGKSVAEVAAAKHLEILDYLRIKTGQTVQVNLKPSEPEILAPQKWKVEKAGDSGICAVCAHAKVDHPVEECTGYVAAPCRHIWQLLEFDHRLCTNCKEYQSLESTMAVEDTLAFRQCEAEK